MEIPEKSNTIDSAILGAFEIMLANLLASIRLPNPGESSFTLNRRMLPSSFSSCASAQRSTCLYPDIALEMLVGLAVFN